MNASLRTLLCGLAMGAADVVPGVSGGTIAFISGIYPRLLQAIEAFNARFFRLVLGGRPREALGLIPWDFLLPLACGIGISIFSLARVVTYALHTWPTLIWSFFFGLIIASTIILGRQLSLRRFTTWAALALGAAFGWLIGAADAVNIGVSLPIFFASGFIAICAMILPGISGSFILVLLGQYAHVIRAVAELDFTIIIVFSAGCLCGIMSFARVLTRLLARFPDAVMAALTGIMAGSLRAIWPWRALDTGALQLPAALDAAVLAALGCAALGMAIPVILSVLAKRHGEQ